MIKRICGFNVCVDEDTGKVVRFSDTGKHLYKWDKKLRCYNNVMPCTVSSFRYYMNKEDSFIQ